MEMPAGDPVRGGSRGDRQLVGNDLKDSDTSTGHARASNPPGRRARRSPLRHSLRSRLRDDRRNLNPTRPGVTYVPRHEGRIPETYVLNPDTSPSASAAAETCLVAGSL